MQHVYRIRGEQSSDAQSIQALLRLSFPPSHAKRGIWALRTGGAIAGLCLVAERVAQATSESPNQSPSQSPDKSPDKSPNASPDQSPSDSTGGLLGSIRYWEIRIAGTPSLVLGPLAVDPKVRGCGIGVALVRQSLARAKSGQWQWCFVSADPLYYLKFGFHLVKAGGLILPEAIEAERQHILALPAARGGGGMPPQPWQVEGV